jgi:hypothetical protein
MKKQISILGLIFLSIITQAQQTCGERAISNFHSTSWSSYQPDIELNASFRFKDSIRFVGTPTLDSTSWFSFSGFSIPSDSIIFSNDSLIFEFNLSTDTSATSYFPQKVSFNQLYINIQSPGDTLIASFIGYIYFTPWYTTEFFSDFDFFAGERQWTLNPFDSTEPTKLFFSQSSFPVCNISFSDTIQAEWQTDYILRTVEGAPFAIKQQMIDPDTLAWYCENYDDSASYFYEQVQLGNPIPAPSNYQFKKSTTLNGTVTGRLLARMTNDHGIEVEVPLRGIQVRLLDKDGWFWEELDDVNSDADGNFTLTCNETMSTIIEGNQLELFIQYKAKNKTYNFEIVRPTIDDLDWDIFGQAVFREEDLGDHGDNFEILLGNVFLGNQDQAFRTANFIWNSYNYALNNVDIDKVEEELTKKKLKVHINTGGSNFMALPKYYVAGGLYFAVDKPTIRLLQARIGHESTIYHEFGHYLMWCACDHNFPTIYSENQCGSNWSFHPLGTEQHLTIVYTEGWASFVGYAIDGANWQNDVECFGRAWDEGVRANWSEFRNLRNAVDNGLKGEDYIAKALYDMWDGPNKGLPEVTNPDLDNILGEEDAHPFNDRNRLNGGDFIIDNTGFW